MIPEVNPASAASERAYRDAPVHRSEHEEAHLTRLIEQQTGKVPSHVFLAAALASMVCSLGMEIAGRSRAARFVGMWPGPLLTMGVYNKLIKMLGPR